MARTCCDGFSRSEALRRAAASGRPASPREWDPRMPVPAGTGMDRRRFLLGAAGGLLVGLRRRAPRVDQPCPRRRHRCRRGGTVVTGARVGVPRRGHRRAVGARAGQRPHVPETPPDARRLTGFGRDVRGGSEAAVASVGGVVRQAPRRGQDDRVPGHRLHRPGHVALHLPSLLGGGRDRDPPRHRLARPLPRPRRQPDEPAPGTLDGRGDEPDARHRAQSGGRDPEA